MEGGWNWLSAAANGGLRHHLCWSFGFCYHNHSVCLIRSFSLVMWHETHFTLLEMACMQQLLCTVNTDHYIGLHNTHTHAHTHTNWIIILIVQYTQIELVLLKLHSTLHISFDITSLVNEYNKLEVKRIANQSTSTYIKTDWLTDWLESWVI